MSYEPVQARVKVIKHSYDDNLDYSNVWEYDKDGNIISRPYRFFGKNRYETAVQVAMDYWHYFKEGPETTIIAIIPMPLQLRILQEDIKE